MKGKHGIAFAAVLLVSATLLGFGYQFSYQRALKQQENTAEVVQPPKSVITQGEAQEAPAEAPTPGDGYYLAHLHGYVVVYYADKHTIYEVTDMELTTLPEEVQGEILEGKYIQDVKELYGFLENYSS